MGININNECFLAKAQQAGLFARATNLDGVNFLIDKMRTDKRLNDFRHAVYMFATVKSETAHTYMPIEEYDNKAGTYLKNKKYYPYYGRGYVQLTWKSNYAKYGKVLGVDLVNNVELAKDPEIAYEVMSIGMLDKPTFTGVNLHKYINSEKTDYVNARRVINGTSGADYFARLAEKFHPIVESCQQKSSIAATDVLPVTLGVIAASAAGIYLLNKWRKK